MEHAREQSNLTESDGERTVGSYENDELDPSRNRLASAQMRASSVACRRVTRDEARRFNQKSPTFLTPFNTSVLSFLSQKLTRISAVRSGRSCKFVRAEQQRQHRFKARIR